MTFKEKITAFKGWLGDYNTRHPYTTSFYLSVFIMSVVIFSTTSSDIYSDSEEMVETLEFVDFQNIKAPKRVAKQEVSEDGQESNEPDVDRASGSEQGVADLDYMPNVAPPRVVGKLKRLYPQSAKKAGNIESVVFTEVLINVQGKVINVRILGVRLSKELPEGKAKQLKSDFTRDARKILMGQQFSPPVVNGEKRAIRMQFPLSFKLD